MNIHMLFGRLGNEEPVLINAWDQPTLEENPNILADAVLRANGRLRTDVHPAADFDRIGVVVVTVASWQICNVISPPNEIIGRVK